MRYGRIVWDIPYHAPVPTDITTSENSDILQTNMKDGGNITFGKTKEAKARKNNTNWSKLLIILSTS